MNAQETAKIIFTADWDWWQIVSREEIELDEGGWEGDYLTAAAAAELNEDDEETWVARVTSVAARHSAIRAGDYCVCPNGIGGDVVFVRMEE